MAESESIKELLVATWSALPLPAVSCSPDLLLHPGGGQWEESES